MSFISLIEEIQADGVIDDTEIQQLTQYITGNVLTILNNNNLLGSQGPQGPQGVIGQQGDTGVGIVEIIQNLDSSVTFIFSDDTSFTSIVTDNTSNTGLLRIGNISNLNDISDISNVTDVSGILFNRNHFDLSNITDSSGNNFSTISLKNNLSDISHLFFNKPDAPTNCSALSDASNIDISWILTKQTRAAFNFINQGINTVLGYMEDRYTYLPYINDVIVGYIEINDNSYTDMSLSNFISINPQHQARRVNKLSVTNSGTGSQVTYNYHNNTNTIAIDLTQNAIGKSYKFRIAYTNNSEDTSWNYLYCPEASGQYLTFGNPGPALPPTSITLSSPGYNQIKVSGYGGAYMDASLNILWGTNTIDIGYGYKITAKKSLDYKQVGGYIDDISFDGSYGFPNFNYNLNHFDIPYANHSFYARPEYIYYLYDVSGSTPIQTFYAINSADDFSNLKVYANIDVSSTLGIKIPDRSYPTYGSEGVNNFGINNNLFNPSQVTQINYSSAINRSNNIIYSNLYFLNDSSNLTFADSNSKRVAANYGDPLSSPIVNLSTNDIINSNISGTFVEVNSMIGSDCSGQDTGYITSYLQDYNQNKIFEFSGNSQGLRKGWVGVDQSVNLTSQYIDFSLSNSTDIEDDAVPNVDQRRTGYYLAYNIYELKLHDISLGILPDICNNNYQPYKWMVEHNQFKKDGTIFLAGSEEYNINTAEMFNLDISLTNFNLTINQPSLNTSQNQPFYGLSLPTKNTSNNDKLYFQLDFSLINLNPIWAPLNALNSYSLMDVILRYNPDSLGLSMEVDRIPSNLSKWSDYETSNGNHLNNINFSNPFIVDYTQFDKDYHNFEFSRDISTSSNQFDIGIKIRNNIFRNTENVITTISNELSGNGLPWWWDFTWSSLGSLNNGFIDTDAFPISLVNSNVNNLSVTLMESVNPFTDISKVPSELNHNNSINYYTAMWAKYGWHGSNISNGQINPYIDYSGAFYEQIQEYQTYDISGINQVINYGPFVSAYTTDSSSIDLSYSKWIVLKLENSNQNTNNLEFSANLTWIDDYIVFYLEKDSAGSNAYTLNGNNYPYTYWMDAQNTKFNASNLQDFNTGQSNFIIGDNNGVNNGSIGNSEKIIKRIRTGSALIEQYLAFGIKKGKTLSSFTFNYV